MNWYIKSVQIIHYGRPQKESKYQIPPIRKPSRKWARNNEENASFFADNLENNFACFKVILIKEAIKLYKFIIQIKICSDVLPMWWQKWSCKPSNDLTSYTPISLLPVISKLYEKLLLRKIQHHLNIRNKHAVYQVHRITNQITKLLQNHDCYISWWYGHLSSW